MRKHEMTLKKSFQSYWPILGLFYYTYSLQPPLFTRSRELNLALRQYLHDQTGTVLFWAFRTRCHNSIK